MTNVPAKSIRSLPLDTPSRRQFLRALSVLPLGTGIGLLPLASQAADRSVANYVKALTFDVFGAFVDWYGSIFRGAQLLPANEGN